METGTVRKCKGLLILAVLALSATSGACEQSTANAQKTAKQATSGVRSKEFEIAGKDRWKDTGLDVQAGDRLVISASGSLQYADARQAAGPDGLPRGWRDLIRILPINQAGRGAVIGRIGESAAAQPFLIGQRRQMDAPVNGRLFLGINQTDTESPTGSFKVRIEISQPEGGSADVTKASARPSGAKTMEKVTGVDVELFEKIPRRNGDKEGTPGDMVNFLIIGSEDKVKGALRAAGWVSVNRTNKEAVLQGLLASLSKQAYVELPMSELYLFDRPQDYGYAQADPLTVVARRHHFRMWKAPFTIGGETVWVGAGTHDIGFDRDQRNNKITHKIDPNIDEERDYIRDSLNQTGQVAELAYLTPRNPLTKAKTAHGQEFHSDGRVAIIKMVADGKDRALDFAELFCSVLKQQPDASEWGACSQWIDATGEGKAQLGPLSTNYRALIVPGVMNSCAESTPAYQEGLKYLREKYGLAVDLLAVPNDSTEANAKLIAEYLNDQSKKDSRKYIVIGYSKGAPDLQTMLAIEPDSASRVAAFVSVAGAIGGTPIAEAMPAVAERWMNGFKFGSCRGDLATAFKSLRRDVRQAFLRQYPDLVVPTYSLAAVSDRTNTSKMLLQSWQLMSAYDNYQDGQLVKLDTIVPNSIVMGVAKSDHFALALPLANTDDASIRSMVDKNRYPRTALLEAILRFVIQDLEGKNRVN